MSAYFANKKILIAGATGFIGTNLTQRLTDAGAKVHVTTHDRAMRISGKFETMPADLTKLDDCVAAVKGMDLVFMCAANTSGAAVMANNPLVHVTPNLLMNSQILEAAYHAKVSKFVFISSGAAYPAADARPIREEEMFTADPYDVYYPVGWMKRYTEILCRMYSEKLNPRMACVVVRPSNMYGPFDKFDPKTSHMMAALLRRTAQRENPFVVWGTGQDARDLLYIDDFIDGLLLAAEKLNGYEPVNIASGRTYSIKSLIETMLKVDGYTDAQVSFDASKPSMAPIRAFDVTKAKQLLGFEPKISLEEGVRRTLAWYRKNFKTERIAVQQ